MQWTISSQVHCTPLLNCSALMHKTLLIVILNVQAQTDRGDHPATYSEWSQSETRLQSKRSRPELWYMTTHRQWRQGGTTGAKIPCQHSSHSQPSAPRTPIFPKATQVFKSDFLDNSIYLLYSFCFVPLYWWHWDSSFELVHIKRQW